MPKWVAKWGIPAPSRPKGSVFGFTAPNAAATSCFIWGWWSPERCVLGSLCAHVWMLNVVLASKPTTRRPTCSILDCERWSVKSLTSVVLWWNQIVFDSITPLRRLLPRKTCNRWSLWCERPSVRIFLWPPGPRLLKPPNPSKDCEPCLVSVTQIPSAWFRLDRLLQNSWLIQRVIGRSVRWNSAVEPTSTAPARWMISPCLGKDHCRLACDGSPAWSGPQRSRPTTPRKCSAMKSMKSPKPVTTNSLKLLPHS